MDARVCPFGGIGLWRAGPAEFFSLLKGGFDSFFADLPENAQISLIGYRVVLIEHFREVLSELERF